MTTTTATASKATSAVATDPLWLATAIYTVGMTVIENGLVYRANWWTQGNDPRSNNGGLGTGQPWTIVGPAGPLPAVPNAPTGLKASATSANATTLTWAAASVPGGGTVTGYAIFQNGKQIATTTGTSYAVNGLIAGTAYSFTVDAIDISGASKQSAAVAITTTAAAGANQVPAWSAAAVYTAGMTASEGGVVYRANWWTQGNDPAGNNGGSGTGQPWTIIATVNPAKQVPTVPTGLTASATTSTGTQLAWAGASVPGGGAVTGYAIFENGAQIATTTATSFTVAGLAAGTSYRFTVEALDSAGASAQSAAVAVTTSAATQAVPAAPTGLALIEDSSTVALIGWNAAYVPDGALATSYAVFENGKQVGTTTATSYTVTGLTANTRYSFTVDAIDAAGASPQSAALAVTTPTAAASGGSVVYAPYIDMGLPQDENLLAIAQASGIKSFTLAFLQSSGANTVGWSGQGTIYSDTLANGTTILSQVQALQAAGDSVIISFGGAAGTDPAAVATSASALQAEYQSVINRYHVTSLDFDIEGAVEANQASLHLRDQALVALKAANPGLTISFTVPVLPTGLDYNGLNIIQTAKHDGVDPNVINIMTMDYGSSVDNGGQMGTDTISAALATEKQIHSVGLTSKLGITPLIGVNDVTSEVFTLADAQTVANFAAGNSDVARIAMWSVARDNGSIPHATYSPNDASGIAQSQYQFSSIFEHA